MSLEVFRLCPYLSAMLCYVMLGRLFSRIRFVIVQNVETRASLVSLLTSHIAARMCEAIKRIFVGKFRLS